MKAAEGTLRLPLDKPLKELTEEDISQLTREDCRRYLKEKGMRRPSWNKSQAIQQVLSLKTLFESWPGKEGSFSRKSSPKALLIDSGESCPADSAGEDPVNVSEGSPLGSGGEGSVPPDLEIPASALDPSPVRQPGFCSRREDHNVERSSTTGDAGSRQCFREPAGDLPTSSAFSEKVGQMTIFYGGKVNVYDDVSAETARAIMVLAASPNFMPQMPQPGHFPFSARRGSCRNPPSPPSSSPTDGPKTRKESVQRFLEKRKDRGRLKGVLGRPKASSSPLEVYLSQQILDSTRNVRTSPRESGRATYRMPVPPLIPGQSGYVQPVFAGDLNEDDIPDAAT